MGPIFAVHITEVNIAVKIGRFVGFYCIEPHVIGWWWYRPDVPTAPRVRSHWFDKKPAKTGIR